MLRSKDYAGDVELTAALDAYLANDSANPDTSLVYLNRAKYDLDRKCEQEEFFLNVLHHQTTNGFQDTGKFAELPTYTISVSDDLTAGITESLNAVVAAAGDTITISIVDDQNSVAVYADNTAVNIDFFDNAEFTGSPVVSAGILLSSNAGTVTFTVPATHTGPLFGRPTAGVVPSNQVTFRVETGSGYNTYNISNGQVVGYYNASDISQSFNIVVPLNSGINANSFRVTALAREVGTNNFDSIHSNETPLPTGYSFTPNAINGSLAGRVEIVADVFTT